MTRQVFLDEIDFLLDECNQFLSSWDKDFLTNIRSWDPDHLSEKQRACLTKIRAKTSEGYAEMESHDGSEFRWDR